MHRLYSSRRTLALWADSDAIASYRLIFTVSGWALACSLAMAS